MTGEACPENNQVCQSGTEYCGCLEQGGELSWLCLDLGGGFGGSGFGSFGGFGGFGGGRAQAGTGGSR
jgi:hypothetical protein